MITGNKKRRSFVLSTAFALLIAASLSPFLTHDRAFAQDEGVMYCDFDDQFVLNENRGEYKFSAGANLFERYYAKAESFTIPDGVKKIREEAFQNCRTLKSIVIPNGVTEIGLAAFDSCSNLTSIAIPESVVKISGSAFTNCRSLKSIDVAENNPYFKSIDGVMFSKDGKTLIECPEGFDQERYVVPNGVRTIGPGAFSNCLALAEVVLPSSVRSIGNGAFKNCASLKSFKIPDGVTDVKSLTFSGCVSLESIFIPWDATSIADEAFADCRSLTEINLPDELRTLGKAAFKGCVSLKSVRIPKSVVEMGPANPKLDWDKPSPVFEDCPSLASFDVEEGNGLYKSIDGVLFSPDTKTLIKCPEGKVADVYTVPDGVETIKSRAFSHCDSIEAIVFPNSVKYMEDAAISDCARLKSLTLPNDFQRVADKDETINIFKWQCLPMLSGNFELASINVQENSRSFKSIDGILYDGFGLTLIKCPSNTEIEDFVVPDSVKILQPGAFAQCSALKTITIHEGVGHIEENSFIGCSGLTAINVAEKNPQCKSINGVLFMRNAGGNPIALVKYPSASDRESYEIPDTVKKICNRAFADSRSLKSVKIPEKVEKIEFGAFLGCAALESIDVDENNPNYRSIDGVLFSKDGTTLLCYPQGKSDENYVVPKGASKIETRAFYGCSKLKTIEFSETVVQYGQDAFRNCSSLEAFKVDENNARFQAIDGVLFSKGKWSMNPKDGSILYKCPMGKKLDNYEVPQNVYKIGDRAFVDCAGITSIKISDGVKELGNEVFENCLNLKTVEAPASVATFFWETFPEGRGLTIRAPKGSEAAYFAARNAKRLGLNFEPIE